MNVISHSFSKNSRSKIAKLDKQRKLIELQKEKEPTDESRDENLESQVHKKSRGRRTSCREGIIFQREITLISLLQIFLLHSFLAFIFLSNFSFSCHHYHLPSSSADHHHSHSHLEIFKTERIASFRSLFFFQAASSLPWMWVDLLSFFYKREKKATSFIAHRKNKPEVYLCGYFSSKFFLILLEKNLGLPSSSSPIKLQDCKVNSCLQPKT